MRAKAITGKDPDSISKALKESNADDFSPTLAIMFVSVSLDRKSICKIFSDQNIDIIGATSAGEFINGYQSHEESAILLLDLNKDHYRIIFQDTQSLDPVASAKQVASKALSVFDNPAFILCSTCISAAGKMYDGEKLVSAFENVLGQNIQLFGGMAGDDAQLTATYVFTNEQSTDEGFATLVLNNDKIGLYGVAISGWKPLGKVRTVTHCEDGWLYTIDDQPALEMYLRYLGQSLEPVDQSDGVFIEAVGFHHPFLALDSGDPVLRTPMSIDKERNAIKLDFPITNGKHFQFTMPPDFDIIETVLQNASIIKKENDINADALLIFSCLGRLSALGPLLEQENEGLHEIWQAPMAGFFSYGEYGKNLEGRLSFNATTCSWVALKEK